MYNFINKDNTILSFDDISLKDLSNEDINDWINLLCINVEKRISEINNIKYDIFSHIKDFDFDSWLKNICDQILKIDNFTYPKWSKDLKKTGDYNEYEYNSIIAILDKTYALVRKIKERNPKNFNELLTKLSYHFIDRSRIIDNDDKDKYIPNKYVAYKLVTLFPKIFSANELITPFNQREYSEQIVIIKEILEIMYPELNEKNSMMDNYNKSYKAIYNRIQIYTVKDKKTMEYSIVFNVIGNNKEGDYYFHYNPKKNTFYIADILDIYQNNIIVSERFKSKLEDTDIKEQKKR